MSVLKLSLVDLIRRKYHRFHKSEGREPTELKLNPEQYDRLRLETAPHLWMIPQNVDELPKFQGMRIELSPDHREVEVA